MQLLKVENKIYVENFPEVLDKLEKKVYMVNVTPKGQYFLTEKQDFKLPSKIYGDTSIVDRWLKAWENCQKNQGILISGLKGGGKTVIAQLLCIKANMPVLIINAPHQGEDFINFMSNPFFKNTIVFIDEFEKVYKIEKKSSYDEETDSNGVIQTQTGLTTLLSLMDGTFPTRFMFVLTVNSSEIDEHLMNRMGRIKYRKHYSSLAPEVIEAVIDDTLEKKKHKNSIIDTVVKFPFVSMDLLLSLINEVNLFDESAEECAKHLNLIEEKVTFDIHETISGINVERPSFYYGTLSGIKKHAFHRYGISSFIKENTEKKKFSKEFIKKYQEEEFFTKEVVYISRLISEHNYKIIQVNNTLEFIHPDGDSVHKIKFFKNEKDSLIF